MRRMFSFIGFGCALALAAPVAAQPVFDLPPPPTGEEDALSTGSGLDLEQAAAAFALVKSLSDEDGGKLWGRKLDGPIMLVDPATRAIVTNAPDRERRLTLAGRNLYIGTLPESVNLGNTAVEWAGERWAMIIWHGKAAGKLSRGDHSRGDQSRRDPSRANAPVSPLPGELLMHECFHRIQPDLGLPLAAPNNQHLDTAAGRVWLRLEWRALAAAVETDAPLASDALIDALIFRRYRFAQFDEAAKEESAFELNEGLAEYTGIRLGGMNSTAQRSRIIGALRGYERMENLTRTFAYASGPAYAALLDDALPTWRTRVGRKTDLAELLLRAMKVRLPRAIEEEAKSRAESWGYVEILAEESRREVRRAERLATHRARYVDNRALIIDLTGAFNYSFEPHTITTLDGIGTVYGTIRATGPWGILDAPGGALMIESKRGRRRLIIPAPPEVADLGLGVDGSTITGDGWTLELVAGWTLAPGVRHGDLVLTAPRSERSGR